MNWFNPLNAELNPIRHLLALVGDRHIVHVSRIMVNVAQDRVKWRTILNVASHEGLHFMESISRSLKHTFWSVRKISESDYQLRHVFPSVRPH